MIIASNVNSVHVDVWTAEREIITSRAVQVSQVLFPCYFVHIRRCVLTGESLTCLSLSVIHDRYITKQTIRTLLASSWRPLRVSSITVNMAAPLHSVAKQQIYYYLFRFELKVLKYFAAVLTTKISLWVHSHLRFIKRELLGELGKTDHY